MTAPGFTTTAEAARRKLVMAERAVERLKRGLDAYIAAEGFRPRDPVGRYCKSIGLDVRISKGAGAEYAGPDAPTLAYAIDQTPMPDALRRFYE